MTAQRLRLQLLESLGRRTTQLDDAVIRLDVDGGNREFPETEFLQRGDDPLSVDRIGPHEQAQVLGQAGG